MGIGTSVVIMAIGAILTFAVEVENAEGFNINTIGIILMVAGLVGLLVSAFVWGPRNRRTVVEQDAPGRTVYRETV